MKLVPISKEALQGEAVNGYSKLYLVKTKDGGIFCSVMYETYDKLPTGTRWVSHPRLLWSYPVEDLVEIYIVDDTLDE